MPTVKDPHRLSRADMEAIIAKGESVMLPNGTIVDDLRRLPPEETLAIGDQQREDAAAAELDRLDAELAERRRKFNEQRAAAEDKRQADADALAQSQADARAKLLASSAIEPGTEGPPGIPPAQPAGTPAAPSSPPSPNNPVAPGDSTTKAAPAKSK